MISLLDTILSQLSSPKRVPQYGPLPRVLQYMYLLSIHEDFFFLFLVEQLIINTFPYPSPPP
jgi:hypothetical protein